MYLTLIPVKLNYMPQKEIIKKKITIQDTVNTGKNKSGAYVKSTDL